MTESQKNVTGTVRLKLYKGNIITAGRKIARVALQPAHRHDGSRQRRLQPDRRHRLHPPQRPASPHTRERVGRGEGNPCNVVEAAYVAAVQGVEWYPIRRTDGGKQAGKKLLRFWLFRIH